jgi:predicted amidophosphoribosyltransferase
VNGSSVWANADYSPGDLCRVCGTLIDRESETCRKCKPVMARVRGKACRLVELARRKRHIDRVFALFTFKRLADRAERMVRG